MNNRFRSKCMLAIAAVGLGLSSSAVLLRADDMKMDSMSKEDMQKKMEEQDKAMKGLREHFDDATFVTVASMGNMDEIKAAEAAEKMSTNDDVKMFAQHMIEDHTKAGDEMKTLADKKGFHVSEMCDAKHMMAMEGMKKMSGADFDKAYVVAAVKDHEDTIALFKTAADNATDSDLKDFVKKEIPTFEDHLSMAKKLESKMMATPS